MAAAKHELEQGMPMAELGVDRLTQEAGVSRSSFYVYFEDRGDLLEHWFSTVVDDIVHATRAWWMLGPDVQREEVRAVLAAIVETYRPHALLMAATYDAATHDTRLREMTSGLIVASTNGLRAHIRRGQKGGWVDQAIQPEPTADLLTWMAERTFHQLLPGASDAGVERLVDAYTDIVFNTLYRHTADQDAATR